MKAICIEAEQQETAMEAMHDSRSTRRLKQQGLCLTGTPSWHLPSLPPLPFAPPSLLYPGHSHDLLREPILHPS